MTTVTVDKNAKLSEGDYPPWVETQVTLSTKVGDRVVTGLTNPLCPGLAVTMYAFGTFDVTHTATGLAISKGYERVASACLALVELAHCAPDWTKSGKEIAEWIEEHAEESADVPSATTTDKDGQRPMTKKRLVEMIRSHVFFDEFPWEGGDGPSGQVHDLLTRMAQRKKAA